MANVESKLKRKSGTPLYVQLYDIMAEQIKSGVFAEGDLLPSISEFCSRFNVSTITVRQSLELLSKDGLVGTRPGRGTFVKGRDPVCVAQKRRTILSLDLHDSPEWELYAFEIKKQTELEASNAGFNVLNGPSDRGHLKNFMKANAAGSSGVILLSSYEDIADVIKDYQLPVVAYSEDPELADQTYVKDIVSIASYQGIIEIVNYLVSLGHKKIATIHGPMWAYQGRRCLDGYKDALQNHKLELRQDYMIDGRFNIAEAKDAARLLLDLDDPPTAIVCGNDYMALGAMSQIRARGLNIPEDISITGFDNIPISAYTYPSLTTMEVKREEIGTMTLKLLIERLANPDKPFTEVMVDTHIKIRASCSKPIS